MGRGRRGWRVSIMKRVPARCVRMGFGDGVGVCLAERGGGVGSVRFVGGVAAAISVWMVARSFRRALMKVVTPVGGRRVS